MPGPDWKQALETGQEFTEVTRARARRLAERLVDQGQITQQQVQNVADEIVARSRRRTAALRKLVDDRVQAQLKALGVATQKDLKALERRLSKAGAPAKKAPAKRAPAKKAAAKKAPARRAPAKQVGAAGTGGATAT